MNDRRFISVLVFAAALLPGLAAAAALPDSSYPDLRGQWERVGIPNWRPAGTPPLTPANEAAYQANRADMEHGGAGGVISQYCFPQGMPMMMNLYDPMEVVITPEVTYILISHVNDSYRRIYTDGWGWPGADEFVPTYAGYSIGKWLDEDGNGRYDALEIETRHLLNPRVYDASGLPFAKDGNTVIKERIYLATMPLTTGSPTYTNTSGIVHVSRWRATVGGVGLARMMSGCEPTNSCASALIRLMSPRPQRRSIRTSRPSLQPKPASACVNAET